jgi:cation diffusion facilitator CzcD-associated flavoprotein CzcO
MDRTQAPEVDVDVIIVGAGISGIGAASRLVTERPSTSFVLVDARQSIGGTWDLFRYPGIRSDSDLITYGYAYKPWTDSRAIAPGGAILDYLRETVNEYDLEPHLRLGRKVINASWSSADSRWTVSMLNAATDAVETLTARWIFSATGYFDHSEGFRPTFEGEADFAGQIIHPQHWPQDLDYTGKRVVIIGSGATAVTMLPALTDRAAHVTMLQRSPSYVVPLPSHDLVYQVLRRFLPTSLAFRGARRANIARIGVIVGLSRRHPNLVRQLIRRVNRAALPKDFDVDTHFNPSYNPWDERMCVSPDGDLFKAIKAGKASVVTDHIKRFTAQGVELESGRVLAADLIVTATGMNLLPFGAIDASVDGRPVDWSDTVAYKAFMLSGVPNFAYAFGYTNNSWTLKVDLVTEHWCRLLAHMAEQGYDTVVPTLEDAAMPRRPFIDDLSSSYVRRGIEAFPRQGESGPWTAAMDYPTDVARLQRATVAHDALAFAQAERRPAPVS